MTTRKAYYARPLVTGTMEEFIKHGRRMLGDQGKKVIAKACLERCKCKARAVLGDESWS